MASSNDDSTSTHNKMRMEFDNTQVEIWAVKENFDVYSDESAITRLTLSNEQTLAGQNADPKNIYTSDTHAYKFMEAIKNANNVFDGRGVRRHLTDSREEPFKWTMEQGSGNDDLRPAFYKDPPPSPEESKSLVAHRNARGGIFDYSFVIITIAVIFVLGIIFFFASRMSKRQIIPATPPSLTNTQNGGGGKFGRAHAGTPVT